MSSDVNDLELKVKLDARDAAKQLTRMRMLLDDLRDIRRRAMTAEQVLMAMVADLQIDISELGK